MFKQSRCWYWFITYTHIFKISSYLVSAVLLLFMFVCLMLSALSLINRLVIFFFVFIIKGWQSLTVLVFALKLTLHCNQGAILSHKIESLSLCCSDDGGARPGALNYRAATSRRAPLYLTHLAYPDCSLQYNFTSQRTCRTQIFQEVW